MPSGRREIPLKLPHLRGSSNGIFLVVRDVTIAGRRSVQRTGVVFASL